LKRTPSLRTPRWLPALALAALGLGACESGFDRNDQIVNSLRILGVRAHVQESADDLDGIDWADADAGDTVEFSALVANPTGDPNLSVTWLACLPVQGQVSPCTYPPDLRDPALLIPMATTDPSSGLLLLGTGTDIQYTIPADVEYLLTPLITQAQQYPNAECGIYLEIPLLVIAQAGGQTFTAAKNFRLSPWKSIGMNSPDATLQFYVRNQNPLAQGLVIPANLQICQGQNFITTCLTDDDCAAAGLSGTCQKNFCTETGPAPTFPSGPQTVCMPVGQPQNYFDCDLDGPIMTSGYAAGQPNIPEYPTVTWYMTGGSLAGFSGPSNGGPPSDVTRTFTGFTRPPGPFTLYGVVRDGRDGEDWVAQDFQ
jgi:hypothetical protein